MLTPRLDALKSFEGNKRQVCRSQLFDLMRDKRTKEDDAYVENSYKANYRCPH